MNHLFSVADHTFKLSLSTEGEKLFAKVAANYAPFREEGTMAGEMLFELSVEVGDIVQPTVPYELVKKVKSLDYGFDVWRTAAGDYAISIIDNEDNLGAVLRAASNFRKAQLLVARDVADGTSLLTSAIMLCYAFSGAYHQTLLVHASVPQIGDTAFLFQGLSGTGKSTHSSLWLKHLPQVQLLNDDNPVVRVEADGQVSVWGSPWSGKTPCYRAVRCRLGGCLRLEQAPCNEIIRLNPVAAFASLLASCSTMVWDKPSYSAICETLERVIAQVPSYHLRCLPDKAAAEMSYQHLYVEHNGR